MPGPFFSSHPSFQKTDRHFPGCFGGFLETSIREKNGEATPRESWKLNVKSGDYQFFEGLSEKTRIQAGSYNQRMNWGLVERGSWSERVRDE